MNTDKTNARIERLVRELLFQTGGPAEALMAVRAVLVEEAMEDAHFADHNSEDCYGRELFENVALGEEADKLLGLCGDINQAVATFAPGKEDTA